MGNLFAELKRRHIYRVAAAYAVVAWVLLQLVNNVAPILDLPVWVARAFLLLLVIGFPAALFFAWMRELAPADAATARAATGKLDWALMGALIVVIALVSYQQLAPSPGTRTVQRQQTSGAATAPAPAGISIAVLPFANMSGDTGQEFFSDGMTEEIMAALAKVSAFRVVGRESAFQFKGQKTDMHAVGQALAASYLIEGSVRKAGDRVRITAQLVQADNGVSLWTESYDRELKDIFATQSDIAQAIAGALRVPLGLAQGETLVSNRTGDLDSYQQYLRARALLRSRAVNEAVSTLEKVVARDPNYGPAWGLLARAYPLTVAYNGAPLQAASVDEQRRTFQSITEKVEMAAREAIRLDPKGPLGYLGLAFFENSRGRYAAADDLFRQALALDPGDPETLDSYGQRLAERGRLKESLRLREQLRTLEPFVPVFNIVTASIMQFDGQSEATIPILEAIRSQNVAIGFLRNLYLAEAYAAAGRYSEAADTLLAIPADQNRVSRRSVEDAARVLRSAPTKVTAPDALPAFNDEMNFVYAHVGALSRVLENPESFQKISDRGSLRFSQLWGPLLAPLRKTERFKTLMRKAGLVDYWRARGWPDLCRPMGADDFVCD